jgi:hypothetical protein
MIKIFMRTFSVGAVFGACLSPCWVVEIAEKVREASLRWYGHVIRRDEEELVRDIRNY